MTGQPRPTNKAPSLCYIPCGATQHSNTDPADQTSPAIPIGPHWMILWPFDPAQNGFPTTVRDAGTWITFAGNLPTPTCTSAERPGMATNRRRATKPPMQYSKRISG